MKNIIKAYSSFLLYILLLLVGASYYLCSKEGALSVFFERDLTFIFWASFTAFAGYIIGFVIQIFYVGIFFDKLQTSINSLSASAVIYILLTNFTVDSKVFGVILRLMFCVVTYLFFDTFRELEADKNILFNIYLRIIFSLIMSVQLYKMTYMFFSVVYAKMFLVGFYVTVFFLVLSLFRYFPNKIFETFSQNLVIKYFIGCFLYIYVKVIREKIVKSNLIVIVEWTIICMLLAIFLYNLIKGIRKVSSHSYEPFWGKHTQTKVLIRNKEFSSLTEYINKFIETGEKTILVVFMTKQLLMLNITNEDAMEIMRNLVEYKEDNLPRYSSRYKLDYIKEKNKNTRFLIMESTIKKFNKVMEEKI